MMSCVKATSLGPSTCLSNDTSILMAIHAFYRRILLKNSLKIPEMLCMSFYEKQSGFDPRKNENRMLVSGQHCNNTICL